MVARPGKADNRAVPEIRMVDQKEGGGGNQQGRVAYLTRLARIELSPAETERLEDDLRRRLDYVSQLNSVDTEKVEPTYHVLPTTNVFREDVVEPCLPIEDVLANAPDRSGTFFRVPRVI